jgi:hypothetical protein
MGIGEVNNRCEGVAADIDSLENHFKKISFYLPEMSRGRSQIFFGIVVAAYAPQINTPVLLKYFSAFSAIAFSTYALWPAMN